MCHVGSGNGVQRRYAVRSVVKYVLRSSVGPPGLPSLRSALLSAAAATVSSACG